MKMTRLEPRHEAALQDWWDDLEPGHVHGWFANREWAHEEILRRVKGWEFGDYLEPGWVNCTTLFLEKEGRLIGVLNLRHELSEQLKRHGGHIGYTVRRSEWGKGYATFMLEQGMEVARAMGIEWLAMHCEAPKLASARVIEKCGGVLEDIFDDEGTLLRRYRIDL